MPATTGVSAIPAGRPGAEVQAGFAPGFYLSQAAADRARGEATPSLSLLIDPDRVLPTLEGLLFGARMIGTGSDRPIEPYLGYRAELAPGLWLGGVLFGTSASGTSNGASYDATRVGAELMIDARLVELTDRLALHGQASVSATHVDGTGRYCIDSHGAGESCTGSADGDTSTMGAVKGVFPAATTTLALDFARGSHGYLHGVRVGLVCAGGLMPLLENGVQVRTSVYGSLGAMVTISFGAR